MNPTAPQCVYEQATERVDGKATFRCKNCGHVVYHCRSEAGKIYNECGRPNAKSPTFLEMMTNAVKAVGNFAASGGKIVAAEVREDRLSICRDCPAFDAALQRCGDCGCFLQVKALLPAEKCPRGKWP